MVLAAVMMDTEADAGSKLDAEFVAEIAEVAPGALEPKEVQEIHLADGAVSNRTIRPGAVTTEKIAQDGVETVNIKAAAVTTAKLADDSVTADKAGLGVSTAYDPAGNPVEDKRVYLTAAQYAQITVPDPNTTYYIA